MDEAQIELRNRELDLQERKFNFETRTRERELSIKERESNEKQVWNTAPGLAILGGSITLITAIVGNLVQGCNTARMRNQEHQSQVALERQKLQSELIQNAVEAEDYESVAVNLNFLWKAGLIPDYDQIPEIVRESGQLDTRSRVLPGFRNYAPDTGPFVGSDDRLIVTDAHLDPFRSICRLSTITPDGAKLNSTGFFVSPSVIVTSAHFLYAYERGGRVKEVSITLASDGQPRLISASRTRVALDWVVKADREFDYGAIILDSPEMEVGALTLSAIPDGILEASEIRVSGYPMDKAKGTQWYSKGLATSVNERRFGHTADTFGGMGGSPVFTTSDGRATVVGIHVSNAGDTRAIRVTDKLLAFVNECILASDQPFVSEVLDDGSK